MLAVAELTRLPVIPLGRCLIARTVRYFCVTRQEEARMAEEARQRRLVFEDEVRVVTDQMVCKYLDSHGVPISTW